MDRVLVTGASGFIGYHLVRALVETGHPVTALVRKTSAVDRLEPLGIELAFGDLADQDSLKAAVTGHAVVYHLAGLVKARRAAQLFAVNQQGVANLCRACAERASPPVLVLVSTLAAAGPAPPDRPRTEGDPPRPVSHYGRSKRAGEMEAEKFADRLPITVVRPPIVFGEADPACLQIFRAIKWTGIHFVPGFRPRKYSVIHAADLAGLLIRAAQSGERLPARRVGDRDEIGHGYYFADCGWRPTYYQLGKLMAKAMGRRFVLLIPFGPLMVWGVSAVSDLAARLRGRAAHFSLDKAREAVAGSWVCSGQKAASQLGFSVAASLPGRLEQTVEWYRREGWL